MSCYASRSGAADCSTLVTEGLQYLLDMTTGRCLCSAGAVISCMGEWACFCGPVNETVMYIPINFFRRRRRGDSFVASVALFAALWSLHLATTRTSFAAAHLRQRIVSRVMQVGTCVFLALHASRNRALRHCLSALCKINCLKIGRTCFWSSCKLEDVSVYGRVM